MNEGAAAPGAMPARWFVVFERATPRWVRWLAMGRWSHVKAFAWIGGETRAWLFYDVGYDRTGISVMPDCPQANALIAEWRSSGPTVMVDVRTDPRFNIWRRFGFWCVPAVAHLIGSSSCAVRPDAFLRDLIRAGGQLVPAWTDSAEGPHDGQHTGSEG